MASKITIERDYILVEPKENDYLEIWEAVCRLIKMPEYPDKNVIWLFREGPVKLAYDDLYNFKEFIEKNYPESATRTKTAMVVGSGLQAGLAQLFAQIAEDLPYEIKVFSDLQSAEDWIAE